MSNRKIEQLWSEVKSQRFSPTRREIGTAWVDEYKQKDFNTGNLLEVFHENTKLSLKTEVEEQRSFTRYATPRYKYWQTNVPEYPDCDLVELPEPVSIDMSLGEAIEGRRSIRNISSNPLTMQELSTLLHYSCGVTEKEEVQLDGIDRFENESNERYLRAYPSGGGLYPVRPYLLAPHPPEEIDQGLYFYVPEKHCLRVLKRDPELAKRISGENLFHINEGGVNPAETSITLVLTAQFWRSMAKYGPRAYRLILQESGHLVQNVSLVTSALGLATTPLGTYSDGPVNDYLDINGVDEAVIYAATIGRKAIEANENTQ